MSIRRPRQSPRGLPSLRRTPSSPAASQPAPEPAAPPPPLPEPAPRIATVADRRLREISHEPERRVREAGGPEDHATYACRCGAVFPATPTTSVSCPLCGTHQAW